MEGARAELLGSQESEMLFLNCSGKSMSRQGFWKVLKSYAEAAGIQQDITPHTLRHSFAAHLVQNGAGFKKCSGNDGTFRHFHHPDLHEYEHE